MNAYHEKEAARLSENTVVSIKNIVDEPGPMTQLHWHNSYEILYVRYGSGKQQINSKTFQFIPGSVTILLPGDIHTTIATSQDGCEIDVLQFMGTYFSPKEEFLYDLKSTVIDVPDKEVLGLFDKIYQHVHGTSKGEFLIVSGAVSMLCGILSEQCQSAVSVVKRTDFARNVCQYLGDTDDIKLERVSQYFGYSPEHFSRRFHADMGISYKHYCERVKMQRALDFFDKSHASLGEIAEALGYSETSSFIRAFKRIYGTTPGNYRRMRDFHPSADNK